MRRAHLWMHCQRIEINLGVLAGLSLVAIVVLSSRRKGEVSAVEALLRVMSNKELGPRKIRVNSLDPGMIETEGCGRFGNGQGCLPRAAGEGTPLGRIGKPDDIALAATLLATDDARWISGQVIVVAG
jgi:3-oxoacyl-[acyl-carrier protein] reductase